MKGTLRAEARQAFIERSSAEVERWSRYVDTLVHAFHSREQTPPALRERVEAMRNKRDTAETKVEALKHHRHKGWRDARLELENARRELRDSWRTVITALHRESSIG